MAISQPATRQILANAYAPTAYISVHTGDPTTANEATGGTPAYARKQTTWTPGTGGIKTGSQVAIDVPPGTYTWVGIWDAATGGNLLDKQAMNSTTLGYQGQILVSPTFTVS
ncbi:phage tail fiber protein [Prescottella equi]|uniref:phage tail fiber protein n=1 Tax=Rhodococcus hoagii TaxID=43767 RepID=UPI0007CD94A8|nr:hypothetical protein [Prescottella equi]